MNSTDIYTIQLWVHAKPFNGQYMITYWHSSLLQLLKILDDMILVFMGHQQDLPLCCLKLTLHARGDDGRLSALRALNKLPELHTVRQESARGLGDAVLTAAEHVGDVPFAVLLGDDLIEPSEILWQQMLEIYNEFGGSVLALMEVSDSDVSKYGIAQLTSTTPLRVTDLVEKPEKEKAPSNLAIIGRYILSPEIFSVLRHTSAGKGGEVQLTDAIATLARDERIGGPVHAVIADVRRFDTGDRLSYLKTVVEFATRREDLGREFTEWLKGFTRGLHD